MPRCLRSELLMITDGRPCFWDAFYSLQENVGLDFFTRKIIIDDSLNPEFSASLTRLGFDVVDSASKKRGFDGAIRAGWSHLGDADYIFHAEDDFLYLRGIPVDDMITLLQQEPNLVQVSLLRGPVNEEEISAGGIIQRNPAGFKQRQTGSCQWVEHRQYFTTNPSVYRGSLVERGWPSGSESEGKFSISLFSDPALSAGIWGTGEVWVEHIGQREGIGY